MNTKTIQKSLLSGALALALLPGTGQAESLTSDFDMYDPLNAPINTDATVVGAIDLSAINSNSIVDGTSTWGVSSTQLFFGLNWTASNGVLYGPGTHTVSLDDSSTGGVGTAGMTETFTVGAGQVAGHIKFAWGTTTGIDVIDLWNISYSPSGVATFTNTDLDTPLDGAPGWGMQDGPFFGFEAVFNLTVLPGITDSANINLNATQGGGTFLINAGDILLDSGHTGGANYQWDLHSDTAVIASATTAFSGPGANTLTIDPTNGTGSSLSGLYTVSVTITDGSGNVARADLAGSNQVNIIAFTMPVGDFDGDGVDNVTEGVVDSDNDGYPDYLDHSTYTAQQLHTSVTGDSNANVITTSAGSIAIGETAIQKYIVQLGADNNSTSFSPILIESDMGTDANVSDACTGGCADFKVSGVTAGSTINVTIPLSQAIPANAVYRKYDSNNGWGGYERDDNNTIASAEALSTGPVTCPAPGDSSYTTGLTAGHFCVQLTIEDNGPNDADPTDGVIADPGGVASTDQFNPENAGAVDNVGGGWWLLLGMPALVVMRRLAK